MPADQPDLKTFLRILKGHYHLMLWCPLPLEALVSVSRPDGQDTEIAKGRLEEEGGGRPGMMGEGNKNSGGNDR